MPETNCIKCNTVVEYKTFRPKYCKECYKLAKIEKTREWQKAHPKQEKERKLEWRKKNREKSREIWKKYAKTDKGKKTIKRNKSTESYRQMVNYHSAKRRVLKKNITHNFTREEWEKKVKETDGICLNCNKKVGVEKLTLDHIFPISKAEFGREYTIKDVQPLCGRCNSKKNDKVID